MPPAIEPPFSPWLRLAHHAAWHASPNRGQGTRRRLLDWQFLLQTRGESWIWFEHADGSWPLRPGDLAVVPPGCIYAWGVPEGGHLAVHFDLRAQPALVAEDMVEVIGGPVTHRRLREVPHLEFDLGGSHIRCRAVIATGSPRRWTERFQPLIQQWSRRDHERPEHRLQAAGILCTAFSDWLELARERQDATGVLIDDLLDQLAERGSDREVNVPALARRVGLGETAFRAAFRRRTGMTPRAWLERRRVLQAVPLLRDGGSPVSDAAAAVGYPDPFHFARVFRRVLGYPPSACRRQQDPPGGKQSDPWGAPPRR